MYFHNICSVSRFVGPPVLRERQMWSNKARYTTYMKFSDLLKIKIACTYLAELFQTSAVEM